MGKKKRSKRIGSFKGLYFKFVAITMSFVTVVLVCVLAVSYGVVVEQNSRTIGEALKTSLLIKSSCQDSVYASYDSGLLSYLPSKPEDATGMKDQPLLLSQGSSQSPQNSQTQSSSTGSLPKLGAQKAYIPMMIFHVDQTAGTIEPSSSTAQIDGEKMLELKDAADRAPDGYSKDASKGLLFFKRTLPDGTYEIAATDSLYIDEYSNSVFGAFIIVALSCWVAFFVLSTVLLRLVIRPVEESCHKQSRFVTDVSHELKTPIAVMMADSEILMETPLTPDQKRWVEATLNEANKMKDLVEELIELSREAELDVVGGSGGSSANGKMVGGHNAHTLDTPVADKGKGATRLLTRLNAALPWRKSQSASITGACDAEATSSPGRMFVATQRNPQAPDHQASSAGTLDGSLHANSPSNDSVPIRKQTAKAVMSFDSLAFERSVELSFVDGDEGRGLPPAGDMEALISKKSLDRLLGILLDNATKYAEGPCVRVATWSDKGKVVVGVENASNINEKEVPLMFDRFYRADAARTRGKESSFGLGLSMARAIVEDCGGRIEAFKSGESGENLTIEVMLPAKAPTH